MRSEILEILNCPFCGSKMQLQQDSILEMRGEEVSHGILSCQCCAYPIVSGIPYLRTGSTANKVLELLGKKETDQALYALLDLDEERSQRFKDLLANEAALTFRKALEILCRDSEALYLFYRFSDPTFLSSQAAIRAIGQNPDCFKKYVLDLGGGAGHLTHSLSGAPGAERVILADVSFWKIWLAKKFIAPDCQPVCCNANEPLPFEKAVFSLVFCSDAFHYIWSKRLLAGEILRLIGDGGAAVLAHLHNSLCDNPSAGMPLSPQGYKNLFDLSNVRLFREDEILDSFLNKDSIDLSVEFSEDELADAQTLLLVAAQKADIFRPYRKPVKERSSGRMIINPLYHLEKDDGRIVLRLRFPSDYYEMEFADSLRYLPESVELNGRELEKIEKGEPAPEVLKLAEKFVVLDVPVSYL
jgi:uncharacterized protein YbaR (Trm112 family)/SAM-dependent methyltransferase